LLPADGFLGGGGLLLSLLLLLLLLEAPLPACAAAAARRPTGCRPRAAGCVLGGEAALGGAGVGEGAAVSATDAAAGPAASPPAPVALKGFRPSSFLLRDSFLGGGGLLSLLLL
jgi:hypothetical protein